LLKKSVLPIVFSLSILILLIPTPNSYATPGTVFFSNLDGAVPGQFSGITTTESVQSYAGLGGFSGKNSPPTVCGGGGGGGGGGGVESSIMVRPRD